jgi:hypothetical protein
MRHACLSTRHTPETHSKGEALQEVATKKHYRKHATNNKQNNNGSNRNGARVVLFSYRAVQYAGQKASGSFPLTGASHHSIGALEQYIVQCLLSPGSDRDGRTARLISQKGKGCLSVRWHGRAYRLLQEHILHMYHSPVGSTSS